MKMALFLAIGMMALCLHGTTVEEARRMLREELKWSGPLDTPEKRKWADQIYTDMVLLELNEGDLALSVYCELLEEHSDNPAIVGFIMRRFSRIGKAPTVSMNQDALDWARKVAREKDPKYCAWDAMEFLSYKGDASDLELVSNSRDRERLATRVAGTNIVEWFDPIGTQNNYFDFTPSVTNVGSQALYAREILYRAWEMLPEMVKGDDTHQYIYRDARKIPAELLTLVVWFDGDGNPVCNVDLSKYGLTMPGLDVLDRPKGKEKPSPPLEPERERGDVESSDGIQPTGQIPPTAGSRRYFWPCVGIAVLILGIGGLYARRKISTH